MRKTRLYNFAHTQTHSPPELVMLVMMDEHLSAMQWVFPPPYQLICKLKRGISYQKNTSPSLPLPPRTLLLPDMPGYQWRRINTVYPRSRVLSSSWKYFHPALCFSTQLCQHTVYTEISRGEKEAGDTWALKGAWTFHRLITQYSIAVPVKTAHRGPVWVCITSVINIHGA